MSDQFSDIYNVFVKGIEGKTKTLQIHKDATIDELIQQISKKLNIPVDELRILYTTKQLEYGSNKNLSDYKMQNNSTVFVMVGLKGGFEEDYSPKQLDEDAPRSDEPDMTTQDDDPNNERAQMPCGHAIGPESITAYCRSLLDAGKFQFLRPYKQLNEWPFLNVRRLAVLTEGEIITFERKLCEIYIRKAMGIQECPQCHSFASESAKPTAESSARFAPERELVLNPAGHAWDWNRCMWQQ